MPDPVTIDVFNESIDEVLRSAKAEVIVTQAPPQYVGLADRIGRAFDEQLQEPLSTIALATSVLEPQLRIPQARKIKSISDAAQRMARMLQDLRDYSMTFAIGGPRLARRAVDLNVVTARILESLQPEFPAQSVEVTASGDVTGEWDADRLATLVTKLIVNAFEHGHPSGSVVRIGLRGTSDRVVFDIWNAGYAPRSIERMFEPFARATKHHARASSGLGLGLFLAREIARAHGGVLEGETSPHDGTTFRLTLPRR